MTEENLKHRYDGQVVAHTEVGSISQNDYQGTVATVHLDSYTGSDGWFGPKRADNGFDDHDIEVSMASVMGYSMNTGYDSNTSDDALLEHLSTSAAKTARANGTTYKRLMAMDNDDFSQGRKDDLERMYSDDGIVKHAFKETFRQAGVVEEIKAVTGRAVALALEENDDITFDQLSGPQKRKFIEQALAELRENGTIKEDGLFSDNEGTAASNLGFATGFAMKLATNEGVRRRAAFLQAEKQRQADADNFNLTQKSGAWSNRNVLKEHAWMLKTWFPEWLKKTHPMAVQDFPGPSMVNSAGNKTNNPWVKYLYAAKPGDAQLFNSSLMAKVLMHSYVFIPPSLHALLVPKMELYVEYHNALPKILRFDEHLSDDDLRRLMAGEAAEIPGVGLMSVDLEDKASNAAEIRKSYVMNLKVFTTNAADFTSKNDTRASFRDLWYNVNTKKENGKPNNILRIKLGWKVPHYRSIMEAAGCSEQQAHDYRLALERNTLTYRLYLQNYNLSIQQNGAIEYEGTYQAAVVADIFNSDIFPMPVNSNAISIKHTVPGEVDGSGNPMERIYSVKEAMGIIKDYNASEERLQEERKRVADPNGEEAKQINDDLREVQRKRQILRDRLKIERFSAFQKELLENESVYVLEVHIKDGKLTELKHEDVKGYDDDLRKAAKKAVQKTKTNLGEERMRAVKFHNLATNKDEVHRIAYTHFGAIFESIVRVIMMNSGGGAFMDKRDFEFHLGKAEIRYAEDKIYWCNVGLLPVPISRLALFMQGVFANIPDDEAPFPFSRLFEMLINDLIIGTLNSSEFFMPASGKNTTRGLRASMHRGHIRQYSMPKKYLDKLWAFPYQPTTAVPQDLAGAVMAAGYDEKNWAIMTGSNLQNNRDEAKRLADPYTYCNHFCVYSNQIRTLEPKDSVRDVYYIHIDSMAPVFLNGSLEENLAKGVHHFFLGSDTGILKEIGFAQKDIQGRQEAIMLSGSEGKQNILHFDANLKLMGNALFSNGDLIYIDPNLGRINYGSTGDTAGEILGMGGYYNVYKVNHSFSRDGYETEIQAKWNNFSGNRKPSILDANSFAGATKVNAENF